MTAASTTSTATHRYAIDIRYFFVTITTAMVLAFLAGVTIGPTDGITTTTTTSNEMLTNSKTDWQHLPPMDETKKGIEYSPSGQHLLIDIAGVEGAFLDSEQRLAHAMVEAVKAAGLTLLSYHCHSLHPAGVSCVGVLLESHISFHTWPEEGVITLDVFTCGNQDLLPAIPKIEALFAIGEHTKTQWSHELRGFPQEGRKARTPVYLDNVSDLTYWVLSPLEVHTKKQIVSKKSKYQQIDIWDLLEVDDTPTYEDGLKHNLQPGDEGWLGPELATPDRILFLDGTLQSTKHHDSEYHEALVHPAMFCHPNPQHVAIVGGGEGATLREVLKHQSLKAVDMIEIDEELVQIAREHLPAMSDCSNLKGRAKNCFDDPLATIIYQDGHEYFINKYGGGDANVQKLDVVIMDALDPEDAPVLSEQFYGDSKFIDALLNSLTDEGVMVVQVGTAHDIHDPRPDLGVYARREAFMQILEKHDSVKAMMIYEEAECGFLEPHSFLVVCKSVDCRTQWMAETDMISYEIYKRVIATTDGTRALKFFDGGTQHLYRYPPKAWETVYCRREPMAEECNYIHLDKTKELHDFNIEEPTKGSFKIEWMGEDEKGEAKVLALKDIKKGSYIMPHHLVSSWTVTDQVLKNLHHTVDTIEDVSLIKDLLDFVQTHGHDSTADLARRHVEVGVSFLIRRGDEANVGRWVPADLNRPVYSPVFDRHALSFDTFLVATRDIRAGEELVKPKEGLWSNDAVATK